MGRENARSTRQSTLVRGRHLCAARGSSDFFAPLRAAKTGRSLNGLDYRMASAYGFFAGNAWTRNVAYGTGHRCMARVHRGDGQLGRALASQEKGFALKEDSLEILQT